MTYKELADQLDGIADCMTFMGNANRVREAANKIRSLPDPAPTPTLEDELRELVGKHECLSRELKYRPNVPDDLTPWIWSLGDHDYINPITTRKALIVVRGIVKAMCDERNRDWLESHGFGWKPCNPVEWRSTIPRSAKTPITDIHPTELAAIDALLTAMRSKQ